MTALRAEGCGIAFGDEYICRLSAAALPEAAKTEQPRLRRAGNAPLLPTAPPPEGEVLAALCLEILMSTNATRRADFPLRGKWCAAPKGVHFLGRSPVVWFSFRYCHKLKLARCPAPIVPPRSGGKVVAPATKGGAADRQHLYGAPQGATATLTAVGCVKPENLRGESPVHL